MRKFRSDEPSGGQNVWQLYADAYAETSSATEAETFVQSFDVMTFPNTIDAYGYLGAKAGSNTDIKELAGTKLQALAKDPQLTSLAHYGRVHSTTAICRSLAVIKKYDNVIEILENSEKVSLGAIASTLDDTPESLNMARYLLDKSGEILCDNEANLGLRNDASQAGKALISLLYWHDPELIQNFAETASRHTDLAFTMLAHNEVPSGPVVKKMVAEVGRAGMLSAQTAQIIGYMGLSLPHKLHRYSNAMLQGRIERALKDDDFATAQKTQAIINETGAAHSASSLIRNALIAHGDIGTLEKYHPGGVHKAEGVASAAELYIRQGNPHAANDYIMRDNKALAARQLSNTGDLMIKMGTAHYAIEDIAKQYSAALQCARGHITDSGAGGQFYGDGYGSLVKARRFDEAGQLRGCFNNEPGLTEKEVEKFDNSSWAKQSLHAAHKGDWLNALFGHHLSTSLLGSHSSVVLMHVAAGLHREQFRRSELSRV